MPTRNDRPTVKTQSPETRKPGADRPEGREEFPIIKDSPENVGEAMTRQPPGKGRLFLENRKKN